MYKKLAILAAGVIFCTLTPARAEGAAAGNPPPKASNATAGDPAVVLLERAKYWEGRNRIDLAKEALEKLFHVAPDHPDGLAMMGLIEARAEHPDSARNFLDKLRGIKPDHPAIGKIEALLRVHGEDKNILQQARMLAKAGRTKEALAAYRKLYPNGPPTNDLALEYWQLVADTDGGWPSAREGLAKLSRENPEDLRYRLALAEHETSRPPISMQALKVIIGMAKLPEYSRRARVSWRRALLGLDHSPANLPLLNEYLAAEPNDSAIKERRQAIIQAQETRRKMMSDPNYRAKTEGVASLGKMNLAAAEPLLEKALRANPKDPDVVGEMGLLRLRQGRHMQAHELFTRALQLTHGKSGKWKSLAKTSKFWLLMQEAGAARDAGDLALAESKLHAARQLDSREPNAIAALARIRADRGQFDEAESGYRQALSIEPANSSALNGLLSLYRQQGMDEKTRRTIDQLSPAQRKALGASLNHIEAAMLRDKASRLSAEGKQDEATAILEQAFQADPDNPWICFDLARQYAARNNSARGQALFDGLLARRPGDTDTLYALALYQSGLGNTDNALNALNRIEASQRSRKIVSLQKRLQVKNLIRDAQSLARSGRRDESRKALLEAETIGSGEEDLSIEIAFEWAGIGDIEHGRALFDKLKKAHESPSLALRRRHAEFLDMLGFDRELREELDAIGSIENLPPKEAAELAEMRETAAIRMAEKQIQSGDAALAHQTLAPFLKVEPNRVRLLLADARAYRAGRQWSPAQARYLQVLQLDQNNREARNGLIETLAATGNRAAALQYLNGWTASSKPDDFSARLQLAGLYLDFEEYELAQNLLDPLLISHPDNPQALDHAWKIAQHAGRPDEQIVYMKRSLAAGQAGRKTAADTLANEDVGIGKFGDHGKIERGWKEKKLAALIDRRSDWVSSALAVHYRGGTAGLSEFHSVEVPLEYKTPWHADDEVFFRADLVKLGAGHVSPASDRFGSMLFCQPACASAPLEQSAQGMSFMAGYMRDGLYADIGVTPTNFPVSNVVGAVRQDGSLGEFSYSIEASRRPVTGSLLSFAGTRDPNTGEVWGGVVATGGRLGLSLDKGETFGFWSSLGLHSLTGRNVQSNGRLQLMAGGQWRIVNEENRLFSLGLTGMYWHHTQNAGEYTFGHGGYYSPLNYRSLSLPVTYAERFPRFSYMLRAAVSASQSQTREAPFFPTNSQLQAWSANSVYAGGPGHGTGQSLKAACEYQMTPQLFVGGLLSLDRSESYAPNRLLFYMRYSLDHPAAQPVFMPPEPVEPSSQF